MKFGLSDRVIADLQSVFRKYANISEVIVFGSRAKGTYRDGSDIDLALVGDGITLNQRCAILADIEDMGILYGVDLVDYNKKKSTPLGEHIKRVGVPLF